jgi:tripartite-type tricarboxylate transporter receptor subunit TctC
MRVFRFFQALLLGMALAGSALAQSGRPIRMIVPLPAGTATDLAARVLGQQMSTVLGQPIVVDNKPGANGTIGVMEMVRAAPDGHTLLLGSQSPLATNVAMVKNLAYDPRKDFSPINGFGETMHVLMVKPGFPAKTMSEFVAYAKQRPGKVSVGSTTSSVQTQIATLNKLGGIDLLVVPYKGIPATITDVIGGSLDATLVDLANAMAQAKAGRLVPIAVTSIKRNPLVPDWPAVSETLPGFDFPSWVGLVGPAGMPKELVDKLNAAVAQALRHPDVAARLSTIGMTPMLMSAEQFKTVIAEETTKWIRLAREANIQPE